MRSSSRVYEIRDPIHGFVAIDALEWEIINQPAFQRLRRIRQLAWTDLIYPGAMHTRFEHSIGVMHTASRLFDALTKRCARTLEEVYGWEPEVLYRYRRVIRLAALLHDIGHSPFSHAGEALLPIDSRTGKHFPHEAYSGAVFQAKFAGLIDGHKHAENYDVSSAKVRDIFSDLPSSRFALVWKPLIAGQIDADRMDYLLRDSYHAGVSYGRYDLDRVINTVVFCSDEEDGALRLGVEEGGLHAIEGLLIARYMMFMQLYFHKTRVIYDYHLAECLKVLLQDGSGTFPPPSQERIDDYLAWDDWRVLGALSRGEGGTHGDVLRSRNHFRLVCETSETPTESELEGFAKIYEQLKPLDAIEVPASKSWYKGGAEDVLLQRDPAQNASAIPLSAASTVIPGLAKVDQRRIYVHPDRRAEAVEACRRIRSRTMTGAGGGKS